MKISSTEGRKAAISYIFLISQRDLEENKWKLLENQSSHMLAITSYVGAHRVIKEH